MKISIVTASLNNAETLTDCLNSLNSQDYENIEHIVQDGGSTDGGLDIVKKISPNSRIKCEPDDGIYDALNKGIRRSTGEIVGILHADDLFAYESVITDVIEAFTEHNCDAVYGDLQYVSRIYTNDIIRNWKSGDYMKGSFLKGWMPPHPTFFVKKEIIDKYGVYNLGFQTAADYEWMLRLIHRHEIKLFYVPKVFVKMRVGGKSNQSFKNRIVANLEDRKAWKINGLTPRWYTLLIKPLRKIHQWI